MRRRQFIAAALACAPVLPRSARGQQSKRLGVLMGGPEETYRERLAIFISRLAELGWRDGQTLSLVIRWGTTPQLITEFSRDLVSQNVDAILVGPTNALKPLQAVARDVPLIFVQVSDPMGQGIVNSLSRPSGNATGFSNLEFSMLGKWLELLNEAAPGRRSVGLLIHRGNASSAGWYRTFESAAPKLGLVPIATPFAQAEELEEIAQRLAALPGAGLVVAGDSVVEQPMVRQRILALAERLRLPALYSSPQFVHEGGLMSYGIDQLEPFRLAAGYVDRILKGEKPSHLPVQQPTRFRFSINLKTAKALGLSVPLTLQVSADEVIE